MNVAVLIVSRNRPDLVRAQAESLARNSSLPHDVYVVEAGTDDDKLCEHSTVRYADEDFRGKAFAHNVALEEARRAAQASGEAYDYFWVLTNDVVFDEGVDAMGILVETMEREPRLGILSPTVEDGGSPGSTRRPGGGWRPVSTCEPVAFMIRASVVETVGFLNPDFRHGWGAIDELSFLVHSNGRCVGVSDDVTCTHLGGTTYGVPGTNTIPREEYQRRARRFAFAYFNRVYGPGWARVFFERAKAFGAVIDTYAAHEADWMGAFTPDEIQEIRGEAAASLAARVTGAPPAAAPRPTGELLRLHLGCGANRRDGWVNVDARGRFGPDLVSSADRLPMLEDSSCAEIEARQLFVQLTLTRAKAALGEWRRLLAPGGELHLELPDLARCVELIGTERNGVDLGLASLFGDPPEVDEEGECRRHGWGWTPGTLRAALLEAGFDEVEQVPITRTEGPAARFDRDMRLVARVAVPVEVPTEAVGAASNRSAAEDEMLRVLAWPRYDDPAELDRFFDEFARGLEGRDDVALFLRVDPDLDPARDAVIEALDATHARVLGPAAVLNVKLLEGAISPREWREIGPMLVCRIPSGSEAAPRDAVRQIPAPVAGDAKELLALLTGGRRGDAGRPAQGSGKDEQVLATAG